MKRSKVIILILALTAMSSCLVSSLHPFYKEEDKYFDDSMVGNWYDEDSCIWTIRPNMVSREFMKPKEPDGSYKITYYEDQESISHLTATLFQLNRVDYVDFMPDLNEEHFTSDLTSYHHIPVHTLARVQYSKDSILLYWYGDEWLNELFEQNRIRIKHETVENHDYDRQVLTASTDELQKFIKKYANDPKTSEEIQQIFAHGYTDDQEEYGVFLKLKPYSGPVPEDGAKLVEPSYNN
jgi:hypothetical protein